MQVFVMALTGLLKTQPCFARKRLFPNIGGSAISVVTCPAMTDAEEDLI